MFELPKLPYEVTALEPYISAETLEFHYGKHHQAYVNNLNNLIDGTDFTNKTLEEIIVSSTGAIFNNSAQVWNHSFYWNCLAPNAGGSPKWKVLEKIEENFESFEHFQDLFSHSAITNFASGWTWLVQNTDWKLEIINTDDAETIITTDKIPLLVIDVWEHAYYIDYRNARPEYIKNFWHLINWDFVEKNIK